MIETQTARISDLSVPTTLETFGLSAAATSTVSVLEQCIKSIEVLQPNESQFSTSPTYLRGASMLASCYIRNGVGDRANLLCEQVFSYIEGLDSTPAERVVSELIGPIYQAANQSFQTRIAMRCEEIVSREAILSACSAKSDAFDPLMAPLTKSLEPSINRLNNREIDAIKEIADTFKVWAGPHSPYSDGFNTVPLSFFSHAINTIVPRIHDIEHKREFTRSLIDLFKMQSPRNEDYDDIADACRPIARVAGVNLAERVYQWIPSTMVTAKSHACRSIALGAIEAHEHETGEQLLKKSITLSFARLPHTLRRELPLTANITFDDSTLQAFQNQLVRLGSDSEGRCTLPLALDLAHGMGAALRANAVAESRFFGSLANQVAERLTTTQSKQQYVTAFVDQFGRGIRNE